MDKNIYSTRRWQVGNRTSLKYLNLPIYIHVLHLFSIAVSKATFHIRHIINETDQGSINQIKFKLNGIPSDVLVLSLVAKCTGILLKYISRASYCNCMKYNKNGYLQKGLVNSCKMSKKTKIACSFYNKAVSLLPVVHPFFTRWRYTLGF